MKRALVLLIAASTGLAACDDSASAPGPRACSPVVERPLRAWARAGFSGSVAIARRGRFECLAAFGTADRSSGRRNSPRTVFDIGSITKAFTAAAVLNLAEAGELSLSDRSGDLLPRLRGPVADATVKQLLLHTSGLKGSHAQDHEPLGRAQALAAIGSLELAFPPGRRFLYSNAGYTLLALIVERVSGTSYRHYLASEILRLPGGGLAGGFWDGRPDASGPRAIGYLEDGSAGERGDFAGPHWAVDGNGGLAMTMRDLAAWTDALFTGRLLGPESVDALTTPGVRRANGQAETPGWVAYDRSVFGEPVFATAGGGGDVGHNAIVAWLPESRRVVAVASNTAGVSAEQLLQAIGPALAAGKPPPPPKRSVERASPKDLARHAGRYELRGGGTLTVAVRGSRLRISADGVRAVAALFPTHAGFSAGTVAAHERNVLALLAGRSQEGRKERAALEDSLGPIAGVELAGTVVDDGELRTYVIVRSGSRSLRLWYALNEEGAVQAAQGPAGPPALLMVGSGPNRFHPDDPTGRSPRVTVTFEGRRLTVSGGGRSLQTKACESCS